MQRFSGLKIAAFKDLIQASGILFLASAFSNFCNLLFWLFMVRRLEPAEYGVLNALFSLLMILSMPASTLQTMVTKYVAHYFGSGELAQIKAFMLHFGKRIISAAIGLLVIFLVMAPFIAGFLKIRSLALVIITGVILFLSLLSPLTMGVLQGAQRFLALAINGIFGSGLKLVLGISLVALGFQAGGALVGAGSAILLALLFSVFQLPRELVMAEASGERQLRMDFIYKYSVPVFFSFLGWMVLTNGDVILVKHFFTAEEAGLYSVAQMVGKIILFLPAVVSVVLFPKMSEAFSKEETAVPLLKKGMMITGALCISAAIFCSLLPGLVLKVLTNKESAEAVRLVPLFCAAMTFYALVQLFLTYNLAVHRFRFTVYLLVASVLQLGLIWLFHPGLPAVLFSLILISFSLLFAGWLEMR
jgi:O-antigen/teichoic acid export membrane protein